MNNQILVVYNSITGFTEQYAKWIAEELNCTVMAWKDVSVKTMAGYNTVIFGSRFHAGLVDGLKKAKRMFAESRATKFIVFATGATANTAQNMIEQAWNNNLTPDELKRIPHFYMQSGLRYEKMPFGDKLMMKVFAAMVKGKKDKNEYEKAMEKALGQSYDFSSREYIEPLVSYITKGESQ